MKYNNTLLIGLGILFISFLLFLPIISRDTSANPPSDTCTYGGSGDWEVDASDNCDITTNTDIGTNSLIITGTGTFTLNANITCGKLAVDGNSQFINEGGDGNFIAIGGT